MEDILRKYGWIPIAFLMIILLILGITRKPSPVDVPVLGSWESPPLVVVCSDSPYSLQEVQVVIDRYEARGHLFEGVISEPLVCPAENVEGVILIGGIGERIRKGEGGHAYTKYVKETGEIVSASIEIRNSLTTLVLEHELGHALGYDHVTRKGHIMYPNTNGFGRNDEGMYRIEIDI